MEDADLRLDGNAAAGMLSEIFTLELTGARARCDSCGTVAELGAEPTYVHAPGIVVRCRNCDDVMIVAVHGGGRYWLGFSGMTWIEAREPTLP
jgi:Family of unknown function (DUF6510)